MRLRKALAVLETCRRRAHPFVLLGTAVMTLTTLSACTPTLPRIDLAIPGWTPSWFADYSSAEAHARETGRPLLIYFKDAQPWKSDPSEDALRSPEIERKTERHVRCVLVRSNEPDRRYVGQFKVAKAPALVLVHPDGTYHATEQELTAASILRFLDGAKPPGESPVAYPFLPRPIGYAWHHSLEDAKQAADKSDRPLLIVLDRPYTRDWERLAPMLHRPEVLRRLGPLVHARPNAFWKLSTTDGAEFGVTGLPAIVLVQPGGRHDVLEMPNSYESIVRFADRTLAKAPDTEPPS